MCIYKTQKRLAQISLLKRNHNKNIKINKEYYNLYSLKHRLSTLSVRLGETEA